MSLLELKEQPVVPATALLCEVTLADDTKRYWASARCQDGANNYQARIQPDQLNSWKLTSDVLPALPNRKTDWRQSALCCCSSECLDR